MFFSTLNITVNLAPLRESGANPKNIQELMLKEALYVYEK